MFETWPARDLDLKNALGTLGLSADSVGNERVEHRSEPGKGFVILYQI
jgi:hypothetical protein